MLSLRLLPNRDARPHRFLFVSGLVLEALHEQNRKRADKSSGAILSQRRRFCLIFKVCYHLNGILLEYTHDDEAPTTGEMIIETMRRFAPAGMGAIRPR